MNSIKCLKTVVIILKKLLKAKNLNKPYNGGLGSYSLFLMAAAYFSMNPVSNAAEGMIGFLDFYSRTFDNLNMGILFDGNQLQFFALESPKPQNRLVILDLMDPSSNTASCVNSYDEIRNCFEIGLKKIRESINFPNSSNSVLENLFM